MAELKKANDYQYEPYEMPKQPDDNLLPEAQPEMRPPTHEPIQRVPASPARHLKRLSKMEKFLISGILLGIIGVSVVTIQLRTSITEVENEISSIQTQITEKEADAQLLEQEQAELSRKDRVKAIAEENGLTINEDNLRRLK